MIAVAVANVPAEYRLVEDNRLAQVDRGNLQVAPARAGKQRARVRDLRNPGAPFVRTHVASVSREEPVVAFEILASILPSAKNPLVEILHDLGARRFRST